MSNRILVACEESQAVTIAFRRLGMAAYSCDVQECSGGHPEWHIRGDAMDIINDDWAAIIAFPPCTYLTTAGNKWFDEKKYGDSARERKDLRDRAMEFVLRIWNANERVCIENPQGFLNSRWRKPTQTIQPWQFGDEESKRTCLWLKNLPKLRPTKIVEPKIYGYHASGSHKGQPIYFHESLLDSKDRAKIRSKTFPGIAKAMANQWAGWIENRLKTQRQFGLFD